MLLSLDIGFAHTGWNVSHIPVGKDIVEIKACGCIHTTKTKEKNVLVSHDDFRRNRITCEALMNIFDRYLITEVAVELPTSGGKSSVASKGMAMASAIATCVITGSQKNCRIFTPMDVKSHVREALGLPTHTMELIKGKQKKVALKIEKDVIMRYITTRYKNLPAVKKDLEHISDSIVVAELTAKKKGQIYT